MPEKQANATSYKPGQSGNPKGRPKKEVCVTSWLKEYASQKITKPIDAKNLTFAQAAALSIWKNAAKGELDAYNLIVDRIEGKVVNPIDMTSKGNEIRQPSIFNIINPETKNLLLRLENGERESTMELNGDIPPEPASLPQSADTPKPE